MFKLEDIFTNMFPALEGLSWDLGTAICGMLMLGFILMAADILKSALGYRIADWMADQQPSGMGELNKLRRKAHIYQNSAIGDYYNMKYKQALRDFEEPQDRTLKDDISGLEMESRSYTGIEKDDWTMIDDRPDYSGLQLEKDDDKWR